MKREEELEEGVRSDTTRELNGSYSTVLQSQTKNKLYRNYQKRYLCN